MGGTVMTRQPRRQPTKKFDRFLTPDASAEETKIHYTLAPFDNAVREMEKRWGIDRLPELVSIETAQKYGFSVGKLNDAIRAQDAELTAQWAAVCIRGLHAMNDEAEAAGKPKSRPDMLEFQLDDFHFAILPDKDWWPEVRKQRPDLTLFSLREVAIALIAARADNPVIAAAKAAFPKAEITKIDAKLHRATKIDDEIPFQ